MVSQMRQRQNEIAISTRGQGFTEITGEAHRFVEASGIATGQLTLFVQHTSASLLIQENADPDVRRDLNEFFRRLVPEGASWMVHRSEGPGPYQDGADAGVADDPHNARRADAWDMARHLSVRASRGAA